MHDLLKFRYFLLFVLIIACRDAPEKTSATSKDVNNTEQVAIEETSEKVILFFGDSLTAGYGL